MSDYSIEVVLDISASLSPVMFLAFLSFLKTDSTYEPWRLANAFSQTEIPPLLQFFSRLPKLRIFLVKPIGESYSTLTVHNLYLRNCVLFCPRYPLHCSHSRPWLCLYFPAVFVPVQLLCMRITEFHVPIVSHPYSYRIRPWSRWPTVAIGVASRK